MTRTIERDGNVVRVDFSRREVVQAEIDRRRFADAGIALGDERTAIWSDGVTVKVMVRPDPEDENQDWIVLAEYRSDALVRHLREVSARRLRLDARVQRATCDHHFGESGTLKKCRVCGEPRAKAWEVCRKPKLGTFKDRAAHRASCVHYPDRPTEYHLHGMSCRRRQGHAGPCRFGKGRARRDD